jgi:hypothetical protein
MSEASEVRRLRRLGLIGDSQAEDYAKSLGEINDPINRKSWPKVSSISGKPDGPAKWPSVKRVQQISANEWSPDWYADPGTMRSSEWY